MITAWIRGFLRQPLLHFLALGLGLFLLFEATSSNAPDPTAKTIVVDREDLLTFIQYRSRAFQPELADDHLQALTNEELRQLIDDYVREEALHREALALGMDANDYVIKRRLIQKVEFITNGFVTAGSEVGDDDVIVHYRTNRSDYYVEPSATFTHVFFDRERHGDERAFALARDELARLNSGRVSFSESPAYGDRFLYHTNYVERVPDFVASHFGAPMAERVFGLTPSSEHWHGPIESPYGFHLIMLIKKTPGRTPPLDEIRERVEEDTRRAFIRLKSDEAIRAIVDGYDVRLEYERAPGNVAENSAEDDS